MNSDVDGGGEPDPGAGTCRGGGAALDVDSLVEIGVFCVADVIWDDRDRYVNVQNAPCPEGGLAMYFVGRG